MEGNLPFGFEGRLVLNVKHLDSVELDDTFLDCCPFRECLARYMNDPLCDSCVNVKLVKEDRVVCGNKISYGCKIGGRINHGDELFISYGKEYWSLPRRTCSLPFQYHTNCLFDFRCSSNS